MLPILSRKLRICTHMISNSAITFAPGHEHCNGELWGGCMTRFTRTGLVSHTQFSECLELTFV